MKSGDASSDDELDDDDESSEEEIKEIPIDKRRLTDKRDMMAANSSDEEGEFGTPEGQMLDDSVSSSGDEKDQEGYGDEEGESMMDDEYGSEDLEKMKKREKALAGSDSDDMDEPSDVDMDSEDLIK